MATVNFKVPNNLEVDGQIVSNTAAAPFSVSSTVKVNNLNADMIDGLHASDLITTEIFTNAAQPTGFQLKTDCVISKNDATRTFSIQPAVSSFLIYVRGTPYTKTTTESVVWPDTEGVHFFFYNNTGTLICTPTFLSLSNNAIVAYVCWDAVNNTTIIWGDERHGITMDGATHEYLHNTIGARYASGLDAGNFTISGNGNNDGDSMLTIANGVIYDEDLKITIVHSNTPTNPLEQFLAGTITGLTGTPTSKLAAKIPVFYRLNAAGDWRKQSATNAPIYRGTNRAYYNQWTGSAWALTEAAQSNYISMWIYATNNISEPIIAIMGQSTQTTLGNAKTNFTENALQFGEVPFKELKCLYRLIYQTASSYASASRTKLVDVADYRVVSSVSGVSSQGQTHASLTGLSNDDHQQYLLLEGRAGDAATNIQLNVSRVRQAANQTASSGTVYLDYATGDYFKVTSTGNIAITLSNVPANFVSTLTLECTNFGAYIITWPAGTKWAGGVVPTLTASGIDLISFMTDAFGNRYGTLIARDIR